MEFIKNLSDSDLEISLKRLVDQERKLLHVILEHIREVEARQLYLARGFESLKKYLVEEFKYSGSAADRRISAALLLAQVPAVAERVRDGSLNLTQCVTLSLAIKDKERIDGVKLSAENKHDLVESIAGLSGRDTQYEIAHTLDLPIKQFEKVQVQADGSYRIEMTLTKQQYENLMFNRDAMAQGLTQERQEINMANVVGKMAAERREEIERQISKRKDQIQMIDLNRSPSRSKDLNDVDVVTECGTAAVSERVNKTVTPKMREMVMARSVCCVFKDPKTGRQCKSAFALQTDHIISRRNGGNSSLRNLQTLCARHNRFRYQQEKVLEWQFFG